MIALVQMLGTARRLRDAIGQLPVPVVGDAAHSSRVTNVLRHDFVLTGTQGRGSRRCASGKNCSVFTDGQKIQKPLRFGVQNDAEEALHHVLHVCRRRSTEREVYVRNSDFSECCNVSGHVGR